MAVSQNNIYQTLKARLDKKSADEVLSELKEFSQFATYYIRICFPQKEPNSRLQRWFERLKGLDFSNCNLLLLNLYRDYAENKISLKQFEQALQYVESYFVRRLFAGLTTRWMDKIFNNLYQDVEKRLQEQNSSNFVTGLREYLKNLPSSSKAQV